MNKKWMLLIIICSVIVWWLSPLYYITLYPAFSTKSGQVVNVNIEPIQDNIIMESFSINDRRGRKIKIIPIATYDISGRVAVTRTYPNYFNIIDFEDILTSDMALVWGKFANISIMKKMSFSHQWTYSGYRYSDDDLNRDPGGKYLSEHFSSNHLIAANKNIDHALRQAGKYDRVRVKGYLINLEIPNNPIVKTSLVRTDNWIPGEGNRGGSEFIYVTEFQNEHRVYR